ncbi:YbhB/YbcL family Raf kinase inhibitor-like protein [Litoribacillus peritrichatus]|uniref:YbhB/YbcL family Raf kinase inhibitor-like protein n=1 Tax=Litoribacillus peritrichatus TaxID=718191 RepID=A0ABP7MKJ0_9GAMM
MKPLITSAAMMAAISFSTLAPTAGAFDLQSKDIQPGKPMPKAQEFVGFGCDGQNLSPQLQWSNPPEGTKSFAITAYDPDAPTGSGWWHWLVYNLPESTNRLASGAGKGDLSLLPTGAAHGRNDYGQYAFGGACPPEKHGVHRYQFKVVALDVPTLELPKESSAALIGYMLNSHKLGEASIEALYQR